MINYTQSNHSKEKAGLKDLYNFREPTDGLECYELWLCRVNSAIHWRQNTYDNLWKRYLNIYLGKHWNYNIDDMFLSSDTPRDKITVNMVGSIINDTVPFLCRQNPKFTAKPTRPEFVLSSQLQTELLNMDWAQNNSQDQLRKVVLDALIFGVGISKNGYEFEFDNNAASLKKDGILEYRDYIKKESAWFRRISPRCFVWDYDAPEKELSSARWCAEIIFKPVADLLANTSYSKDAKSSISSLEYDVTKVHTFLKDKGDMFKLDDYEKDSTLVVCFEIWDKKYNKYYFFADGVPVPLIEKDWPYDYLRGFPYHQLTLIPSNDDPYGLSMVQRLEDQQYELNRNRTSMFQHRRRFNRKYEVDVNNVEPDEISKLQKGADGTIVRVNQAGSIRPIQDANMSNDIYQVENIIKEDIRELSGSDELMRGGRLPSRTSATEVNARSSIIGLKLDDKVDRVDNFVVANGHDILGHYKKNMTLDRAIKLLGPKGEYWATFTREDIQGEYDLELQSTSVPKIDPDVDKQQRTQLFQMLTQLFPMLSQSGVQINIVELLKWLFEAYGEMEISRFFPQGGIIDGPIMTTTQQSQQQQQQQQQQINQQSMQPPNPQQQMLNQQAGQSGQQTSGGMQSALMGQLMGMMSNGNSMPQQAGR